MKHLLVAGMLLLCQSRSHADIAAQAIAENCRTCHRRADSEISVPDFEQLTAEEISLMLLDFKYGKPSTTLMPRIAKGYSDKELRAVARNLGKP